MSIKKLKQKYSIAKKAKVGEEVICPSCGTHFVKKYYHQAFCQTKGGTTCKDYYWNNVTPNKRNNTTRISPASAAWLATQEMKRENDIYSDYHPYEGLNDDDYKNF